ncbi:hypothetical protein LEP1GSC017_0837 [Leptospira meyeri serovar Hardjo str. Went 5]|nr:hypothetical protein LEP1GSC017_0837 [Leptospira meyeri serovar Hardjo str. Went 5]EMJ88797.1 hypothetical protein LEP1GSC196_2570 [Leptospira meyeri serovar Semaranga str. Veldrot Semarang 173]
MNGREDSLERNQGVSWVSPDWALGPALNGSQKAQNRDKEKR